MSKTYNIQCDDCKKTLWIGQRDYIYTGKEHIKVLENFLHNHINHKLSFVNDENIGDEYEEIESPD